MNVLLIEDDPKLGASLYRVMKEENYRTDLRTTGKDGLSSAQSGKYDVIVLDWMLPDLDGLAVCASLREAGCFTPILMLTARSELADRVAGLRSGADDYLVKPFEVEELLARLQALVRRASRGVLRFGGLEIDCLSRTVSAGGAVVDLTAREYSLLVCLAERAGTTVSRANLLLTVWAMNFDPGTAVIEVHISRLRDKLGRFADQIETVRGAGYRLRTDSPP